LVTNNLFTILTPNKESLIRAVFIALIFCAPGLYATPPQLIVNTGNIEKSLTRNTLRAIYSMRVHRWPDGTPIIVFVLPDAHFVHQGFARKTLLLFPHQLRRSWDRYVYSGIGTAPIEVKSEQGMIHKVATVPGAIGYTRRDVLEENVRTLFVQ
jgi:ABC-type phosphate transport system substrate-binding protein